MLPTLIDPELYKTGKLTKDKQFSEEKEMKESKVDNVEESQASIISIKEKNDKVEAYITYTK